MLIEYLAFNAYLGCQEFADAEDFNDFNSCGNVNGAQRNFIIYER